MKKILVIIPARGGSKGLKDKNIKLLNNKPLIAWTIEAAKGSKYIDKVIVSTDNIKIAEIAKEYGAEVPFIRPDELSGDKASSIDVILHAMNYMNENLDYKADYIMLLQCTSPLRTTVHIDEAVEKFIASDAESLVSTTELEHPIFWCKKINDDGYLESFIKYDDTKQYRRQEFETLYRLNGAIYISKWQYVLNNKRLISDYAVPYIMDKKSSIDIDNIDDFNLANYYMLYN
jgi:N-acylneuraminate cytidylyltransferase/CMP-N,N'-diacetyllegionaminic acid synthase